MKRNNGKQAIFEKKFLSCTPILINMRATPNVMPPICSQGNYKR